MIEVQGLTKKYGRTVAVDNLNFSVKKGEILGFLGPNGAGKTTTMRVITGYMPPTSGNVTVAGFNVMQDPLEVKKRVGYLPESPPLYPDMRVDEMLAFAGRIKGVEKSSLQQRMEEVAEKTAISDVRKKIVGHLSKGYRQRVGLAVALINSPDILILDEPTAGLDPKQIIETRKLILSLAGEHTIILSTHILPEAANTCHRVMIINNGRLVAEDTPENLTARLQGFDTLRLVVDGPQAEIQEKVSRIDGVGEMAAAVTHDGKVELSVQMIHGKDLRSEIARAVVESGWGLMELRPLGMSLEDIFLQLTTKESLEHEMEEAPESTVGSFEQ